MSFLCLSGDVCLTYAEMKVTGLNNMPSLMRVRKKLLASLYVILANLSRHNGIIGETSAFDSFTPVSKTSFEQWL
jgi:hypothetical protein